MGFDATAEQVHAVDRFRRGSDLVIEAGAGAGKTTVLRMLADTAGSRRVLYVGFNRSIVVEARRKMPPNVTCSTAHALAWHALGKQFASQLDAPRRPAKIIAADAGISAMPVRDVFGNPILMDAWLVAATVAKTVDRYCTSASVEIDGSHVVPPDGFVFDSTARAHLVASARRAWQELTTSECSPWTFTHNVYLKLWSLDAPVLPFDVVLFDEAQDANPPMAGVVRAQSGQKVLVGDSAQAIYGFNGAVDALASFDGERCRLTQSFRFGPAIADIANHLLAMPIMDTTMRIVGTPSIRSFISQSRSSDAVLCRTNASTVIAASTAQSVGKATGIVGGTKEIEQFAYAAARLMKGEPTDHPMLSAFGSWGDVTAYVRDDPTGSDLAANVGLINRFGVRSTIDVCKRCVPVGKAVFVASTAHRAKGLEWDSVRLADDFPDDVDTDPAEARLLYVAATRARVALHVSDVDALADQPEPPTAPRTATRPTPTASLTPADRAQADGGARTIGTVIRATLRSFGRRPAPDLESR